MLHGKKESESFRELEDGGVTSGRPLGRGTQIRCAIRSKSWEKKKKEEEEI